MGDWVGFINATINNIQRRAPTVESLGFAKALSANLRLWHSDAASLNRVPFDQTCESPVGWAGPHQAQQQSSPYRPSPPVALESFGEGHRSTCTSFCANVGLDEASPTYNPRAPRSTRRLG